MVDSRTDYPNQTLQELVADPMMRELFAKDGTNGGEVIHTWLAAMQSRDAARGSGAHAR